MENVFYMLGVLELLGYDRDSLLHLSDEEVEELYISAMDGRDPMDFEGLTPDESV